MKKRLLDYILNNKNVIPNDGVSFFYIVTA